MADDNKITFSLDLDAKEFTEGMLKAKGAIEGLGESKSIDGLVEGLLGASKVVGTLGVAFLALKTTMETVFEAEDIKQINNQFEILTKNAGLAGDTLKEGLVEAAKGLVDDTDLLKAANKAIVEMGGSAAKLPELMELARKSTAVYGGEAIDRFEQINRAIASGSERQLKHLGIIVDVQKAYKDYAASLGVTSAELNEAGKRQALLNAVLEKGADAFDGVDESVKGATNTWKQFLVTLNEIKEVAVLVFEKTMGPVVRSALKDLTDFGKMAKDVLVEYWGDGAERAAAQTKNLEKEIIQLQARLYDLQKGDRSFFDELFGESTEEEIKKVNQQIEIAQSQLNGLHAQKMKHAEEEKKALEEAKASGGTEEEPQVNKTKQAQDEAKFQQEILRLKAQRIKQEEDLNNTLVGNEVAHQQEIVNLNAQTQAKIAEIRNSDVLNEKQKAQVIALEEENLQTKILALQLDAAARKKQLIDEQIRNADDLSQYEQLKQEQRLALKQEYDIRYQAIQQNADLSEDQKRQARLQAEQMYHQQVLQMDDQTEREREAVTDRWVQHGNNAAQQWARGFARGSMDAQNSLMNFGAQGTKVMGMFTNHAADAFMKLGEGSKKGSAVMREAMLGMIADIAQYYGQMMLAAGIFPPNPLALGAGAALLVLAGYLRSQVKSSSGGGAISGGMGGGDMGSIGGGGSSFGTTGDMVQSQQKQAKSVHIEVQGNYFETDQTRTRLTEMVRESLDATDFSIQKVGGGI